MQCSGAQTPRTTTASVPPSTPSKPRCAASGIASRIVAVSPWSTGVVLQGLRVDVDDDVEPVATHRRHGRGEEHGDAPGDGARLRGLGDQLRAMAAAQPKHRRRPEQVGVDAGRREALAELRSAASGAPASGPETRIETRCRKGG